MLRNYRIVVVFSGPRSGQILGPLSDRGQNDVSLLQEFATLPGGSAQPRGLWFLGSGFGESETVAHNIFLSSYLRATLRHADYASISGNPNASVALAVSPPPTAKTFGVLSNALDVFNVNVAAPAGQAKAYYENIGASGPYVASVWGPQSGGARPFVTLLDGFDLADLGSLGNTITTGRNTYVSDVLGTVFGSMTCAPLCATNCTGVPADGDDSVFLDLASNPAHGGRATIRLVMPRSERAKVAIYDVTGRRLKTLADGLLAEEPHTFVWDGTDASGAPAAAGVYWVRVGTTSGMRASKTFVLLR
jgi:hypothetical protein